MTYLRREEREERSGSWKTISYIVHKLSYSTSSRGHPVVQDLFFDRDRKTRDQHLKGQGRIYQCSEKDCSCSELGFASEREFIKFVQLCHRTSLENLTFPNVLRVSTSKALKDASGRDDALATREMCNPVTVSSISETGFLLRVVENKCLNAAMVFIELLETTSEVNYKERL